MISVRVTGIIAVCIAVVGCSESEMPAAQKIFSDSHRAAVKRYAEADNDLQYKTIWDQRERNICEKLPSGVITDWTGKVESVGSNRLDTQESANIDIRISETKSYLLFKTSAVNMKTLGSIGDAGAAVRIGVNPDSNIVKGTPMYDQLMSLKKGDKVQFSGQLIKNMEPGACFYELSRLYNGKFRWPEYVVKFKSVKKID